MTNTTLTLSAAGGRETRAYGGDENALEHEFINTLHVFIVSGNSVVKAYHAAASDLGSAALEGNLLKRTIQDIQLATGTYTVYAFANFTYCYDTNDNSIDTKLSAINEGSPLSTLQAIGQLKVANPAATINFDAGQFIPMATDTTLTLTTSKSTTIPMHRLVDRIDVSVINTRKTPLTISTFEMGKFATEVYPLPNNDTKVINTSSVTIDSDPVSINPGVTVPASTTTAQSVTSFYVNATEVTTVPFTLNVKLAGDDTNYSGSTSRTSLPRNSVLPITLRFSEYEVNFEITAQVAPIGGYPITVLNTNAATEDILISLPEGSTFTVTPKLQRNNGITITTDNGATYQWTAPTSVPDWFSYTLSDATITGKVPAEADLSFTDDQVFTLTTTATNGKQYINRLRFKTVAIDNTTK